MKDKLVIWGENEKDEKVMLGIQLLSEANKIEIYVFPESTITESFEKAMMNEWRKGEPLDFPEGYEKLERDLSMSDSLLPDSLKTKQTDLVKTAQLEWHLVVLSQKLSHEFKKELEELKEKVENLSEYSSGTWNDLKSYWSKVQTQIREKTLVWKHTAELKETTNGLFDKMKTLRTQFESELQEKSVEYKQQFSAAINEIDEKLKNDGRLKPLFEDLKNLQKKFWDTKFISKHRNELKKQFDKTFKVLKEKRFGNSSPSGSPVERIDRRLNGLENAIGRMKTSIGRDKKELEFQQHRIDTTDGQLEAQIRQAKINVVQERISSKEQKLADMVQTKDQLESRLVSAKEREKQKAAEAEKKVEIAKAKEIAKEKIASEIKEKDASISETEAIRLQEAAEKIKEPKVKKITSEPSTTEKIIEKAAPLATSIKPKITRITPELKSTESKVVETKAAAPEVEAPELIASKTEPTEEASLLDSVMDSVSDVFEDIVDSVKAVAEVLEEKVDDFIEEQKKKDSGDA